MTGSERFSSPESSRPAVSKRSGLHLFSSKEYPRSAMKGCGRVRQRRKDGCICAYTRKNRSVGFHAAVRENNRMANTSGEWRGGLKKRSQYPLAQKANGRSGLAEGRETRYICRVMSCLHSPSGLLLLVPAGRAQKHRLKGVSKRYDGCWEGGTILRNVRSVRVII